jgi:hypothetical protein
VSEPVIDRVLDGVASGRLHPGVQVGVQILELLPDLLLGLPGHLPADRFPSPPKPSETAPMYRFLAESK